MELTVFDKDGVLVTDSRDVSEMTGKRHADLMASISGYIQHLTSGNFRSFDFFIPSTYRDTKGEKRPCYLITRKGCDMIAHKMTGKRGVQFTAAYVDRFYKMERAISLPQTYLDALKALVASEEQKRHAIVERDRLQMELDYSKEWYSIKRVAAINGVEWKRFNWRSLKSESDRRGINVRKVFDANYGEVNTYHHSVWESLYPDYEL